MMEELQAVLRDLRKESASIARGGCFFPTFALAKALTPSRVLKVVADNERVKEHERDFLVSLILERIPKIFSILLYDGNQDSFLDFLHRQEFDSRLPITDEKSLQHLKAAIREKFMERQWEFIPVLLKKDELHRNLRDREILPYLKDEYLGSGGFGQVYKVIVCRSHQGLMDTDDKENVIIARKQLRISPNVENERGILELLRTIKHPNIVKLLGSYTYRDDQNLLFPVADMNLHEFFRKDGIPPLVILYAGMFGLSDALVHIHNFQFEDGNVSFSCVGYHHDLKPKNILVRGTTFLLADFGLSRLKMEDQSSRTRLKGGEDDYLSPESFNHHALLNGLVGRALDMWSFGCILAEFATFINFGTGGVDFFRENRKDTRNIDGMPMTDYAFHLNGLLRPAVNEWLVTLKTDPEDEYLPRLVDLVRELLKPEWRTRIQAQAASRKLASIYFDTRVGAIQALMSLLLVDQNQARPTPVLILLEQMRFAAWKGVYRSTIEGDTATSVNDTFKILEEMYHGLTLATQQPGSVTGNDIDSRLSASHKTICQHIDSLRSKFPETLKRDMDEDWIQAITEMDDIEMLDQIKAASIPLRYRLVGIKAAMKQLCLAIMDSREVSGKTMVVERGLVELDLRQDNKFSEGEEDGEDFYGEEIPQTGTYESETGPVRVLVEWLGYDARFKKYAIQMHARLEALAKLLSPEQTPRTDVLQNGILECVGYFHDECSRRFGFIYQMPPAESGTSDALTNFYTLNYIIRWRDPTMKSVRGPCLGDLFKFAHAFVSCVHGLHEVGWMHKRISSFSLLTFAESEDKAHEQVASCRLAGFSDSRPATSNLTMGPSHEFLPYQHPEYSLRTGYKRQYDYYSVGVVLLEVGLWTPISKIWSAHNGIDDTQAFRRTLLEAYVPELGERMGSVYRDAVALCLEAQALEDLKEDTTNQSPAQRSFKSGVVDMLAKCYA